MSSSAATTAVVSLLRFPGGPGRPACRQHSAHGGYAGAGGRHPLGRSGASLPHGWWVMRGRAGGRPGWPAAARQAVQDGRRLRVDAAITQHLRNQRRLTVLAARADRGSVQRASRLTPRLTCRGLSGTSQDLCGSGPITCGERDCTAQFIVGGRTRCRTGDPPAPRSVGHTAPSTAGRGVPAGLTALAGGCGSLCRCVRGTGPQTILRDRRLLQRCSALSLRRATLLV